MCPHDDTAHRRGLDAGAGAPLDQFVSYSANREDVMLRRLFAGTTDGFYVDVGAAHPVFENDTKMLYDLGWHGINIEPNPVFFGALMTERTRDRNLCVALGDHAGEIDYYDVVGTGLSTCDPLLAERARQMGRDVIRKPVRLETLASILDAFGPPSIDLLKIDVEGLEERVLAGNDWTKYRPAVVLVEATYPESPLRRENGVRTYLERQDYEWRYFDGLNDYYVGYGFTVPERAFDSPPNLFDRFKTRVSVEMEAKASTFEQAFKSAESYALALKEEAEVSREYARSLEIELRRVQDYARSLERDVKAARDHAAALKASTGRRDDSSPPSASNMDAGRRDGDI